VTNRTQPQLGRQNAHNISTLNGMTTARSSKRTDNNWPSVNFNGQFKPRECNSMQHSRPSPCQWR
jgi:hypothetical protein